MSAKVVARAGLDFTIAEKMLTEAGGQLARHRCGPRRTSSGMQPMPMR